MMYAHSFGFVEKNARLGQSSHEYTFSPVRKDFFNKIWVVECLPFLIHLILPTIKAEILFMMSATRPSCIAMMMTMWFLLFGVSPVVHSFQISPILTAHGSSSMDIELRRGSKKQTLSKKLSPQQVFKSSIELRSTQDDNGGENLESSFPSIDAILGITASLVVLYSEYTLKTTGCGLPAGRFGIVGAAEGLSYLGVVGICANAASKYFSDDESSETGARSIATTLGISAALVGLAVLGFQIADYGYIPNAVPMEGGMCK